MSPALHRHLAPSVSPLFSLLQTTLGCCLWHTLCRQSKLPWPGYTLTLAFSLQVRKPDRRRWCTERLLNFRSLKKAVDIRKQLAEHLKQLKVRLAHLVSVFPVSEAVAPFVDMHSLLSPAMWTAGANGQLRL